MIAHYVEVTPVGVIVQCVTVTLPAPAPSPSAPLNKLHPVAAPISWNAPTPTSVRKWVGGAAVWVETAGLADQKIRKIEAMNDACSAQILAGFACSALGAAHHYPAKAQDQNNLSCSVYDSLIPGLPPGWTTPFWCVDANGVWELRPHTATQIQQIGRAGRASILAALTKNEAKREAIAAAATQAQLDSITW